MMTEKFDNWTETSFKSWDQTGKPEKFQWTLILQYSCISCQILKESCMILQDNGLFRQDSCKNFVRIWMITIRLWLGLNIFKNCWKFCAAIQILND